MLVQIGAVFGALGDAAAAAAAAADLGALRTAVAYGGVAAGPQRDALRRGGGAAARARSDGRLLVVLAHPPSS